MDAAVTTPPSAPKRKRRNTKQAKLANNQEQILAKLDQGQSLRSVAADLGTTHSTLSKWLDSIDQSKQELTRFRSTRIDALSTIQAKALKVQAQILDDLAEDRLLATLTPAQKGNLLHALVVANGNAFDKERLESGQSTANISTMSRMLDVQVSTLYKREASGKPLDQQSATSQPIDQNSTLIMDKS